MSRIRQGVYFWPNVPGQVSPLAFGMTPAREAEKAGGMTKVPKAWGLAAPARWAFIFVAVQNDQQEFLGL
jgi:hypothetical protein